VLRRIREVDLDRSVRVVRNVGDLHAEPGGAELLGLELLLIEQPHHVL
jgi:hypothetical protein